MKLVRILNKLILFLYYTVKCGSLRTGFVFAHYRLPLKLSSLFSVRGNKMIFKDSGNQIQIQSVPSYSGELEKLVICLNDKRVRVIETNNQTFTIAVSGITLHVNSISNLVTLYELYLETIYDIDLQQDVVVMDIGMNVCYAALWFSARRSVKKVYCYEPFTSTYQEGMKNLALNPSLTEKITTFNAGISTENGELVVPMMGSGEGGASINSDVLKVNNSGTLPTTNVSILDIIPEMKRVLAENPGYPLLMKIDCEGEEYPIFEKLDSLPSLDQVAGFIIEWHIKGPETILAFLRKKGYRYISLPKADGWSGMIYAFSKS